MKTKKAFVTKVLAFILSLMLIFSAFPVTALAAVEEPSVNAQAETEAETSDTEQESYAAPTEYSEEALEPEVEPEATQPTEEVAASEALEPVEETVVPTEDKTDVAAVAAPEEEVKPTVPPMEISDGFYLFGPKNHVEFTDADWHDINKVNPSEKFMLNTGNKDEEEYMLFVNLTRGRRIKVVEVQDNKIVGYYPDGLGTEYTVPSEYTGSVVVYFTKQENEKEDWEPFGKHFYISKTIIKKNEDGSETTVNVEEDTTKPTMEIKGYAYKDGDNIVDWDNKEWISVSKKPYVKVEAKDEGFGINVNSFTVYTGKEYIRPRAIAASTADQYYLELPGKDIVQLRVSDNAGNNISPMIKTEPLKIDDAKPTADDVVKGVFSAPSGDLDKILNVLTFGLYTNNQIAFTVYVSSHDGSPISEIDMKDDNGAAVTKDGEVVAAEDGFYTQKFLIDPKDESVQKNKQPYRLKISAIKDSVYEPVTVNKSFLDIDLYTDKTLDSNKLEVANKDLYELVNTLIKPSSEIALSGDKGKNDILTSKDKAISFKAAIADSISGISEKAGSVKVYVGYASKLKARDDGSYNVNEKFAVSLDESSFTNKRHDGSGELSGKLLSETVSASIPVEYTANTGQYRIVTEVRNNSNNIGYKAVDFDVDNDVPVISEDKVLYQQENGTYAELTDWTNRPVRIQFKATDAANKFGKGVKPENIVVIGSHTGSKKPYAVSAGEEADTYYADVDLYQDYMIIVRDDFGHTANISVEQDRVLYDKDIPVITDVKYDGFSYEESSWKKKVADGGGVTVSFSVTDFSSRRKNVWLSGKKSIDIEVIGADGQDYSTDVTKSFSDTGWTCEFVSDKYQTYTITVTDHAKNVSDPVTTEKTKVDDGAPKITNISFRSVASNTISELLHFLSFGIYHDQQIIMIVETTDEEVSSGIREIKAYYENEDTPLTPYGEGEIQNGAFNNGEKLVATREFILEEDKVYNGQNIFVYAEDVAAYHTGNQSLVALNNEGRITNDLEHHVSLDLSKYFDIVGSSATANIVETSLEYKNKGMDDLHSYDGRWYPGDVIDQYNIQDSTTKINSVKVELNGADITSACVDDTGEDPDHPNTVPNEYSHWNETDSGAKISNLNIKYDSSTPLIAENLHRTSDDGKGENHVVVTVVSNNGRSAVEPIDAFYIDNTIPTITGIDFEGYSTDKPTGGAVMKTTYGYYFKDSTKVTVTANDVGSGVNNIHLYGIRATSEQGTINFDDTKVETAEKAEFTIPANFKGQLVAYAYDNVNNRSLDYNPDGLIVESEATHPNVSGSKITINTNPVGSDQDGVKLFSGDVSVSFDIYDMYSGLKDVSYRIIDTANPNPEFITVNTNDTPVNASYVGDWRIDNIDSNLAHRISRTITVAAQEHNDNGVKIQLKGTDRAGFEIPMIEETISIDITKPIIKVEYDPVSPTDTHNGENYFNNTRTATITVTERNFNPDQIDWSKFVALEGSRPSVVGISNWSASYAIGTASAVSPEQRTAVHTAQITFADDGKFELDFDYTDLAGNSATKDFEVQKFYIDKTKPVMTVEMKYSSSPRYSQDNMATIRIVEHNFDPDSAHFTYTPTATGPDYASGGTAPTVGAWSSSGDEHTATINFPDEGKYSFKLTFKDLATNAADDYSEPEFYVDHTAEKPVFDETKIKDHFAYDSVVTPAVIYHDNSFNSGNYSFKLTRHAYDFEKMEQVTENVKYANSNVISKNSATGLDDGARVDYENFPNQEIADGIYTLYAEYTDLANNHADNSITFSVNRFGSVFLLGNVTTTNLVDREYTNEAPDVVIREISAIQHKSNSVSLSYNSSSKKLDDKQYKVDSPNTVGRWYEYLYDVFADNFKNEGEYTVTVSSRYSVGGKDKDISNRTANTDGQVERNCPVSFIVDKTTPTVSISGVENGKFYSEAEKNLKIICTDDNIDKESLVVKLDDQVIDLEKYGATVNEDLFGEIDVDLPIAADGKQTEHSIVVEVKDLAGNDADNAVNAFTLSATFLTMFFHNPVALGISGAVLAALIGLGIVLVLKKRKKA